MPNNKQKKKQSQNVVELFNPLPWSNPYWGSLQGQDGVSHPLPRPPSSGGGHGGGAIRPSPPRFLPWSNCFRGAVQGQDGDPHLLPRPPSSGGCHGGGAIRQAPPPRPGRVPLCRPDAPPRRGKGQGQGQERDPDARGGVGHDSVHPPRLRFGQEGLLGPVQEVLRQGGGLLLLAQAGPPPCGLEVCAGPQPCSRVRRQERGDRPSQGAGARPPRRSPCLKKERKKTYIFIF